MREENTSWCFSLHYVFRSPIGRLYSVRIFPLVQPPFQTVDLPFVANTSPSFSANREKKIWFIFWNVKMTVENYQSLNKDSFLVLFSCYFNMNRDFICCYSSQVF
jgi:hypothetical protein